MEGVLNWGLDVIRVIQTISSPALTQVMQVLTLVGSEYFYLLFLPILFWCIDEKYGVRFGLIFLFSSFVNSWLKLVFAQPRPFDLDSSLGLSHESSYGLPSGHAQGTSTFWGLLAPKFRRPWGLLLAIAVPLLVSFTRLYLGVHFPTDIFLGLALGWGFALTSYVLGDRLAAIIASWNFRIKILVVAALALLMNALSMSDTSMSGVFFGTAIGAIFLFEKLSFNASSGTMARKAARFGLGLIVLVTIYVAGKLLSPGSDSPAYALVRFVRYGLLGVWVSLGAPWLFLKLKLADPRSAKE